ncbi:hypothetical protein [Porphyromonas loveana]|uniref:hypothetical protein n=1 Tax=Porphyromonas loveana TaxID=1884669 RepID=UPI0035A0E1D7
MRTNKFFASMATKALALAAAVMMSMAFTACSSNDDTPTTPQEPTFTNTVTIDGEKVHVLSVEYKKYEMYGEIFTLYLYLSENKNKDKDCVEIKGYTAKHLNKDIDLTKVENTTPWQIICFLRGKKLFDAYSMPPSAQGLVFGSGKLRIDGNLNDDEITIRLTNGKITDADYGDGKEHTVSISWKGKAKKI